MSEKRKPDRRIARTQNALWSALQELLQDHSWNNINIKMICDTADVARSSFYGHFGTKSDLLDFGFVGVVRDLTQLISKNTSKHEGSLTLSWLVDHISANTSFFTRVSQSESDQIIFARFRSACEGVLSEELRAMDRPADATSIAFAVGGSFAVIRQWVEAGCIENTSDLKQRLITLATKVLAA